MSIGIFGIILIILIVRDIFSRVKKSFEKEEDVFYEDDNFDEY